MTRPPPAWLWPLVAALAAAVVALPAVSGEWMPYDDAFWFALSPILNPGGSTEGLARAWREPHHGLWVPATQTVWWLVAAATEDPAARGRDFFQTGLAPMPFELLNVLLHAATAALVCVLLTRLDVPRAAAAAGALLFAVHPVQVESVAWTSGTKDVLGGALAVGALLAWRAWSAADQPRAGPRALALLLGTLAMLAKPAAIVLPLMLLALEWGWRGRRSWREIFVAVGALALPAVVVATVAARVQSVVGVTTQVDLAYRPLVALDALAFYLRQLFVPAWLAFDHGRTPERALAEGWVWWTWAFPAATAVLVAWLARSRRVPRLGAAALLALLPLVPVLGLKTFSFQYLSTVAEHYLYPSMPFVALAAGLCLARFEPRRWATGAAVVLAALAATGALYATQWRTAERLLLAVTDVNPRSHSAWNNLAVEYMRQNANDAALAAADRSLVVRGDFDEAHLNRALALVRLGRPDEALAALNRISAAHLRDGLFFLTAARAYRAQGNLPRAVEFARRAADEFNEPQAKALLLELGG